MSNPLQDSVAQIDVCTEDFSINFIGKELFFSNQTLRSVQSEFGVAAHRYDDIAHLKSANFSNSATSNVVVVDQIMLDDLLARPDVYTEANGSGCLAFAYRKEDTARSLFENWDRGQFGDIGYLPMNVAPDVWRSILRLLMHEELYLPSFLADCVSNSRPRNKPRVVHEKPAEPKQKLNPIYSRLTRREKQVLHLVSKGQSNKIIALNLGITEHTVKLHMHNVAGKIGVSNRTAAAQFYFEVAHDEAHGQTVE
ncbi:putative transcriptional regulatory protein NarL [Ruegeria denitrificans]|uniref:Putative transcriptional regulatory protein NarL n=1 Tax=Ruegeria denitrificans TaxID=1715692 RepID=A0A0P1ICX0_9RHOB|nr:response regulator transcription factor [Ruegeria denitrificans]CUK05762.1 putative transcriptional regulatory protein NarL [Ruegeria denitrificans]